MLHLRTWLRDKANGKWLLVLDNVDDLQVMLDETSGERRIDQIPCVSHGSMIVTSRCRLAASKLGQRGNIDTVNLLQEDKAVSWIMSLSAQQGDNDVDSCADLYDGLPLTSTHVFISDGKISSTLTLEAYVEGYLASNDSKDVDRLKLLRWLSTHQSRRTLTNPTNSESRKFMPAETGVMEIGIATDKHTEPSHTAKDSGYGSYATGSVLQRDVQEQEEASDTDVRSTKTLSSFVDLGLDGRLRGINIFASDLVQSLSPDIQEVAEGRELMVAAIQDALRAYSYSLEQQNRPDRMPDERKAAHFVRQQSQ
jgi:hypothetical protein